MRRRELLAGGALLFTAPLAGCGHPPVVLDLDAASAADVAARMSITAEPDSEEYTVIRSAIENGSATRRGRSELFGSTDVVRFDGAFYRISETRLGSSEVTVYEVLVDLDPTSETPALGEVRFDDLPEPDRRRLEPVFSEQDPPEQEGYDMGVGYGSAEEVGNGSVFVPEREYDVIVYRGDRYRVAVNSRTAAEADYRYEVTTVAPDVESFADGVRAEYLFELAGLSEAERAVVEAAIESGHYEDNDAFRSVVEEIRSHDGLEVEDFYGTWLLEYEGTEYLAYAEW